MAELIPIKRHAQYRRYTKLNAAMALREAKALKPTEVLVIGVDGEGDLFTLSCPADPGNALWLMAMATRKLTGG